MTTVCASLITKDEAHCIEACIKSLAPYVVHIVILDTGSSDGTPEIARDAMKRYGVSGEVYAGEFHDFAQARNDALALSCGHADYIMAVDADWTFEPLTEAPWEGLHADMYMYQVLNEAAGKTHYMERILKDDPALAWHWVHPVHEAPKSDSARTYGKLPNVMFKTPYCAGRSKGRAEWDLRMLRGELEKDPNDDHALIYLCSTLCEDGQMAEAWKHCLYLAHLTAPTSEPERRLKRREGAVMMMGRILEVAPKNQRRLMEYQKARAAVIVARKKASRSKAARR